MNKYGHKYRVYISLGKFHLCRRVDFGHTHGLFIAKAIKDGYDIVWDWE